MESVGAGIVTRKERIPELDGLRAIAIGAVFLHHALQLPLLWAGVDVFFVLSGFLITGILLEARQRPGGYFRRFYTRRIRRILPAYAVALVLLSLLFGWGWLHRWYWFVFFATNIGESLRRSHFSLQPFWSLGVEEQFYMVWPLVVLLVSTRALRNLCIAALFVAPLLRVLCTPLFANHFPIYYLTPFRADLLCAGGLIAIAWREDRARLVAWSRYWWVLAALALGVLLLLSRDAAAHTQSNTRMANGLLYSLTLMVAAGLLLGALRGRGWWAAVLRLAPLRYLGVISYSMYLVHAGAILLARRWFVSSWLAVPVAALLTAGYATVAWYGWERRILHPRTAAGREAA